MTTLMIDQLKDIDAKIVIADCEDRFVMFSNGVVLPITQVFDEFGNETDDDEDVRLIVFGSDEMGWGEMQVDGLKRVGWQ